MYIKDEHPMRSRVRYYSSNGMRGLGIGPEIVTPEGCVPILQQSSPPLNGLMTAMTDTYTTLTPVMASLPARTDFDYESARNRRFAIQPVEATSAALNGYRGYGRARAWTRAPYMGFQRGGGGARQGQSREFYGGTPSLGTCIGC